MLIKRLKVEKKNESPLSDQLELFQINTFMTDKVKERYPKD